MEFLKAISKFLAIIIAIVLVFGVWYFIRYWKGV